MIQSGSQLALQIIGGYRTPHNINIVKANLKCDAHAHSSSYAGLATLIVQCVIKKQTIVQTKSRQTQTAYFLATLF